MLVRQALQFPCWEYSFTTTPAFSVCSPLAAAVCSQTQKPQCGRRWAMLPAPFTLYGAIGVGRKEGKRELAQFPEMSGSLGRAPPPGQLPHCSWSHRHTMIPPVPICSRQFLSGLQWNWATRIQPPVSYEQSSQVSRVKKGPLFSSQVQGVPMTKSHWERAPDPPEGQQHRSHLPTGQP